MHSSRVKMVVYRTIPTSNHNTWMSVWDFGKLYIVLFLHQTTTVRSDRKELSSCISYYSYIKPQPIILRNQLLYVVYRTIPTSNHNHLVTILLLIWLYIVLFLHQTTTRLSTGCNCSTLYIVLFLHQTTTRKTTPKFTPWLYIVLFLHQTTTETPFLQLMGLLYIVLFLHQTTTPRTTSNIPAQLYIVLFLHQTTTDYLTQPTNVRCISYYSYIKPQRRPPSRRLQCVVYRTIPTSNHN